mgnify:CR=1 FL=1
MAEEKQKAQERIVRILAKDIEGGKQVLAGLSEIKGMSWSFANAVCNKLNIDKNSKIGDISQEKIDEMKEFVKNPNVPRFLINRRNDLETGEDKHLLGSDLDLRKSFDIKRERKIKSYKGFRHALGLTVNGQRTRGNFRRNKSKGVGIKKKSK